MDITFKKADTFEELHDAFSLLYESYLFSGLTKENPNKLRISPYQLQNNCQIFIAKKNKKITYTVSFLYDSGSLPIENIYPQETKELRLTTLFGEVTCFAGNTAQREFLSSFLGLMRLMAQSAKFNGVNNIVATVHPDHTKFYYRLGFVNLSNKILNYSLVNDKPAVPIILDFSKMQPPLLNKYFGNPIEETLLIKTPISEDNSLLFSTFL